MEALALGYAEGEDYWLGIQNTKGSETPLRKAYAEPGGIGVWTNV